MCSRLLFDFEVVEEAREIHILTSYRPLGSTFIYALTSAFLLHNETLNVWTHLLPLFYFLYYMFIDIDFWNRLQVLSLNAQLPLYGYMAGVCALFATSSFAHLFSCAWSHKWWKFCYMLDYAAITVYGSFSAIVYYLFNKPEQNLLIPLEPYNFMAFLAVSAITGMWINCYTRLYPGSSGYTIRTLGFAVPAVLASAPAISRFIYELSNSTSIPQEKVACTNISHNVSGSKSLQTEDYCHLDTVKPPCELQYCQRYIQHFLPLAFGALINVVKVPERWWPGKFDVFGHSHQLFHILIFVGVQAQFWLIMDDVSRSEKVVYLEAAFTTQQALIWLSTGSAVTASAFATVFILISFHPFNNTEEEPMLPSPELKDITGLPSSMQMNTSSINSSPRLSR